jgi:hypothetical protein
MPSWFFKPQRPGDTTRDPIQGEFFATEAISNPAEALVREGIQNSLDAGRDGQQVKVRIRYSGDGQAISAERIAAYLDGAWPHLQAPSNGLRDAPEQCSPCHYLVFEDFGTTGLEGHVEQWRKIEGSNNGFFTFFRAEGQSDKQKGDRGRWGIGKFVFPRSSRISTFWGLTVRDSDKSRLLMGRCILKSHAVADEPFVPDGYFGKERRIGNDDVLIMPVSEPDVIDRFCADFGLTRGTDPGLSIVVPYYDLAEITAETILRGVIQGYFYPILCGSLVVTAVGPEGERVLDAASLEATLQAIGGDLAGRMIPLVELAKWGRHLDPAAKPCLEKMPEAGAPKWKAELIPPELTASLLTSFQSGERVALRVPFPVREKNKPLRWSYFDILMVRDGSEDRGRPVFIREGIIVSDIRSRLNRGVRSLVINEAGCCVMITGFQKLQGRPTR